jgi:hypothetical protein
LPSHRPTRAIAGQHTSHAEPAARIDEERATWLVERGYDVMVDAIPADVSAKNRLQLKRPRA